MTRAPQPYDLVIVGASFAGLVAAKTAAMRGLRVAVLEEKQSAGDSVRTTGILFKEAAEEVDLPHNLTRRVYGVRLYAPNLKHFDLFAPGSFFLTTETGRLLNWFAQEAMRAGAQILYRTPFQGAERRGGVFVFSGVNISARHIVGADGARSAVARCFGLGLNRSFLTGIEVEFEGLEQADPRFLHCFLDSSSLPATWPGLRQGLRFSMRGSRRDRAGGRICAPSCARRRRFSVSAGRRIAAQRRGRIPCGGLVSPWATDGITLIGDAAGMVSPATGGGIGYAIHYGRRAAHVVADNLLHLGPPPEVALRSELPRFWLKHATRLAFDLAPPNALISAAHGAAAHAMVRPAHVLPRARRKGRQFQRFPGPA